jgi:transcriptional regulator with XRE-family HTH domain
MPFRQELTDHGLEIDCGHTFAHALIVYANASAAQAHPTDGRHNTGVHSLDVDTRQLIRDLMSARGFTKDSALARAADIPQPTLSRYLNGHHSTLNAKHWMALARALHVTVSELLGETPLVTSAVREVNGLLAKMSEADRERAARLLRALVDNAR